jgi:5-methylcytosine-specific restriction endonuclease McrA
MKTKVCTKCKRELDISCFYKHSKLGVQCWCKFCTKQYRDSRIEQKVEYDRQHYKNNVKRKKQYRDSKTKITAKYQKQHRKEGVLFRNYSDRLNIFEEVRRSTKNLELLEVRCSYCGKWMQPTNMQVNNRLQAFNGKTEGEARFYCSENCKLSCPIFNQKFWPKGFKKATSREVVPLLRQLVLERDNYTCQKCWATTETAQLHVHHEKSYTLNKIMANDPDNCITLCKNCHKLIHSRKGCRYMDLKCKGIVNGTK